MRQHFDVFFWWTRILLVAVMLVSINGGITISKLNYNQNYINNHFMLGCISSGNMSLKRKRKKS